MSGIVGAIENAATGGIPGAMGSLFQLTSKVLDKFPDEATRNAAKLALAQLEQSGELAELAADVELTKAGLADVASARGQTVSLAQAGSKIAWGAPVVSVMVVAASWVAVPVCRRWSAAAAAFPANAVARAVRATARQRMPRAAPSVTVVAA